MGLDMYLEKCHKKVWGYRHEDIEAIQKTQPDVYNEIKKYLHTRGTHFHWEDIFEEVAYWRKANAIHRWFVDNVQGGVDNCDWYEVSKEKIMELLAVCCKVWNSAALVDGLVEAGKTLRNGEWETTYTEGRVLKNTEVAAELLPTQSGFFFGGTGYDEWYLRDIEYTIDVLDRLLKETDFENEVVAYRASW